MSKEKPVIAFGPEMPGFGSWEWVGVDTANELSKYFQTVIFRDTVPECDVVVFVKFKPSYEVVASLAEQMQVVYCPIDFYGSCPEIDSDALSLRHCSRVLIHCERLHKYYSSYAPVDYVDHHLKFVTPLREHPKTDGPILWTGVRTNLPPLVEWVNRNPLPDEFWILTNPEDPTRPMRPADYGFRTDLDMRMEVWNEDRHLEWLSLARAAIDIKGNDFRSRHKPPAKAIDFIASGVPLAMNAGCSSVEHLARLGLKLAEPTDHERWLSAEYAHETIDFAKQRRGEWTLPNVGLQFRAILNAVLDEKESATTS